MKTTINYILGQKLMKTTEQAKIADLGTNLKNALTEATARPMRDYIGSKDMPGELMDAVYDFIGDLTAHHSPDTRVSLKALGIEFASAAPVTYNNTFEKRSIGLPSNSYVLPIRPITERERTILVDRTMGRAKSEAAVAVMGGAATLAVMTVSPGLSLIFGAKTGHVIFDTTRKFMAAAHVRERPNIGIAIDRPLSNTPTISELCDALFEAKPAFC